MDDTTLDLDKIDTLISECQDRLDRLVKLRAEIKDLRFYEVGIRKSDNAVCFLSYRLEYNVQPTVLVTVLPPFGNPGRITLDEWKNNFVEYSQKARTILPKKS